MEPQPAARRRRPSLCDIQREFRRDSRRHRTGPGRLGHVNSPEVQWFVRPAPSGVDIHGQPSNAVVGQPISPAITVAVVDAKGNTITTNNTQLVTLVIASGPAGAKLLGTTTVRAVNG